METLLNPQIQVIPKEKSSSFYEAEGQDVLGTLNRMKRPLLPFFNKNLEYWKVCKGAVE